MVRTLAAIALLIGALTLSATPEARATSFAPAVSVSLDDLTAEANSSISMGFTINQPHAMFQTLISFIPPEFGVASGGTVPDGAVVGSMQQQMTLGLIGNACNQLLEPDWELRDGSTDTSDTVGSGDSDHDFIPDYADDEDGDGLPDGVTRYPETLVEHFGAAPPRARVIGITPIAGRLSLFNILVFEPGTDLLGLTLAPSLGYPSVLAFSDPGTPLPNPEPGAITDWCSFLQVQFDVNGVSQDDPLTTADEAGYDYRTNPATAGTYPFGTFFVSLADADGDGIENQLDTCPYVTNIGNPRITNSGDLDGDGLDAACDPNNDPIAGGLNSDHDSDGYLNRHDNCPLVQNGQSQAMNQTDSDLDGIGDSCDIDPNDVDGHQHVACLVDYVIVGTGGAPDAAPLLPCDSDGDDVLDSIDNCPTVANAAGQGSDADGDLAGDACDGPGTGNVDCTFGVNAVDSLKVLRHSAGLSVAQNEPCLDLGMPRALAPPDDWKMGDVNCSGGVNSVDALFILRANAGLSLSNMPVGCPAIKPV